METFKITNCLQRNIGRYIVVLKATSLH